jgi:hypothetical protein
LPLLTSFFYTIKDGMAVSASVPVVGATENERLRCFYEKSKPPAFTLAFPDGVLAADRVDPTRMCVVMFDFMDQAVTIDASINAIKDCSTLELVAQDITTHEQVRNYFRVDASTRVAASSVIPKEMALEGESWRLLGDTIDLSGSGLLCSFSEPLEKGTKVRIELTLPTRNSEIIKAFGYVVRCRKIQEHLYHIALHFDLIDSESQDKIMACCFELQRRYLRMRVRLEGYSP